MDVTLISVVLAKTPSETITFHLFIHLHVFPYKLHGITGSLYIFFLCKLKFNLLLFLVAPFFTTYLPPYTGIQSKTAHKTSISAVLLYMTLSSFMLSGKWSLEAVGIGDRESDHMLP